MFSFPEAVQQEKTSTQASLLGWLITFVMPVEHLKGGFALTIHSQEDTTSGPIVGRTDQYLITGEKALRLAAELKAAVLAEETQNHLPHEAQQP